jgi:hypothetical protein
LNCDQATQHLVALCALFALFAIDLFVQCVAVQLVVARTAQQVVDVPRALMALVLNVTP